MSHRSSFSSAVPSLEERRRILRKAEEMRAAYLKSLFRKIVGGLSSPGRTLSGPMGERRA